jgi:hypothetical protein
MVRIHQRALTVITMLFSDLLRAVCSCKSTFVRRPDLRRAPKGAVGQTTGEYLFIHASTAFTENKLE